MARFMLLFRGGAVVNESMSPADRTAQIGRWSSWMTALKAAGHYLPGGSPLKVDGAVVRTRGREVDDRLTVDATLVTGTYLLEASSLAEATELAKECPILDVDGTVEIRPILDRPQ